MSISCNGWLQQAFVYRFGYVIWNTEINAKSINSNRRFTQLAAHCAHFTLCSERFCTNIWPSVLNRNTLNARCNLMFPSGPTRWQSLLDNDPNDLIAWTHGLIAHRQYTVNHYRSFSSTKIQFSLSSASSCSCWDSLADRTFDNWRTNCLLAVVDTKLPKILWIMVLTIRTKLLTNLRTMCQGVTKIT